MKKEVKIQFDYGNGPLWKDKFNVKTGEWATGVPCIDNDKTLQALNDEAQKMFESLYSFNNKDGECQFNNDRFTQIKAQLLSIAQTIIDRLADINDGTFVVVDKATKSLL